MSTETRVRNALGTVDTNLDPEFVAQLRDRLGAERDDLADVTASNDGAHRSRRPLLLGTIAAALALVIGIAALGAPSGDDHPVAVQPTDPRTNNEKAAAFAQHLLSQAWLPDRSERLPDEVIHGPPCCTHQTFTQRWSVPMSVVDIDQWLRHNVRKQMKILGSDSTVVRGSPTELGITFTPIEPLDPAFASAELKFGISSDSTFSGESRSFVDVTADVRFHPERPADAHIPASATVAVIALDSPIQHTPFSNPVTLTDARVQDIVAAIEAAPVPPDGIRHCPMDTGDRYVVRFGPSFEAAPDAVVAVAKTGCRGAVIAKNGRDISPLEGNTIVTAIEEALRGRP